MKCVKQPIVTSSTRTEDTITHGTLTLIFDGSYHPEVNARQYAYLVADYEPLGLKEGEKVYFHYLTILDKPNIPPDKWLVHPKVLYCVIRDGEIEMLNDYTLVEIEEEPKASSLLILPKKKSTSTGIVKYTNTPELKEGDRVIFKKTGAFENKIEGVDYYVMDSWHILCKILDSRIAS